MANFNLGRIKGDKGDKGDMGPMGPAGAAGERGERGERGDDGLTPVFSVGETVTLSASEEAYVDINTDDPQNPVISFYIPKGSDGKDASGDMQSSVYDTEGIKTDFFKYADNLAAGCIKTGGGSLGGALKAAESPVEEGYVRNICIGEAFPETAANGDICIIVSSENTKILGDCQIGDIMLLDEEERQIEYIIVAKDFHAENSVTLVRERLAPYEECFDAQSRGRYTMSDIDCLLETTYVSLFPKRVRNKLMNVKLSEDYLYRHCFLLSYEELSTLEYFSDASLRRSKKDGVGVYLTHITRTLKGKSVYSVDSDGEFLTSSQGIMNCFRPTIVLPSDIPVENTEHSGSSAVKLPDVKCGTYVYVNGEWKECQP